MYSSLNFDYYATRVSERHTHTRNRVVFVFLFNFIIEAVFICIYPRIFFFFFLNNCRRFAPRSLSLSFAFYFIF